MKKFIYIITFVLIFVLTSNSAFAGTYEGVGIYLNKEKENTYPTIVKVSQNSPAAKDCIQAGQKLISVNGKDTSKMPVADIVKLLRGETGTYVNIVVDENGSNREYKLERTLIREYESSYPFYKYYYHNQ